MSGVSGWRGGFGTQAFSVFSGHRLKLKRRPKVYPTWIQEREGGVRYLGSQAQTLNARSPKHETLRPRTVKGRQS